jgi:hypothetical protein
MRGYGSDEKGSLMIEGLEGGAVERDTLFNLL